MSCVCSSKQEVGTKPCFRRPCYDAGQAPLNVGTSAVGLARQPRPAAPARLEVNTIFLDGLGLLGLPARLPRLGVPALCLASSASLSGTRPLPGILSCCSSSASPPVSLDSASRQPLAAALRPLRLRLCSIGVNVILARPWRHISPSTTRFMSLAPHQPIDYVQCHAPQGVSP